MRSFSCYTAITRPRGCSQEVKIQAPSVPNATTTSAAQTKSNIDTATAAQELNMVNQVTPTGSISYSKTGTNADGTPIYTATSKLSDTQQGLLNQEQGAAGNLLGQIKTSSSTPFSLNTATENKIDDLASQRLLPQQQRDMVNLQQQLANKGIQPGTAAYNNAMTQISQQQNDARNSLYLNGYNTAEQASLSEANLPYNQLASLSGTQQTGTNLASTPATSVQSTDVAGNIQNQYANQLGQYTSNMNSLGSIASTLGGWLLSDKNLKTDIHDTGMQTPDGIPMKTFRYKGSPMLNLGVIAQDAEKVRPDAVINDPVSGYKGVDYSRIGSPMLQLGHHGQGMPSWNDPVGNRTPFNRWQNRGQNNGMVTPQVGMLGSA